MIKSFPTRIFSSLLLVFIILGVNSCKPAPSTPVVTALPPTIEPTAAPTQAPASLVLVDPSASANAETVALLTDFSNTNTLVFEQQTDLSGDFTSAKIVVVFGSSDLLPTVASANPATQFIVISNAQTAGTNISVIQSNPTHLAFMAGYIAIITADDWRAAGLIADPNNLGLADAFFNGGEYFCGQCTPVYPPYKYFPVYIQPDGTPDVAAWVQQVPALSEASPNSIFMDTSADDPQVLDLFPGAIFYTDNLATPNRDRYVAILGVNATPALEELLPQVMAGQGGQSITAPVALSVIVNEEKVTPGKLDNFNQVAQDLADDLINPLSVP